MSRAYDALRYWFVIKTELPELSRALKSALQLCEGTLDCENQYEWFEAEALGGNWGINVSRKRRGGDLLPDEPYHLLTFGAPMPADGLAAALCRVTHCRVFFGRIEPVSSDGDIYHALGSCDP